jgi:phage I-like protein
MAERTVRLDLGVDDVHVPSATPQPAGRAMTISAAKRRSLPGDKFAVPGKRAYPIDTAARTRNAAARLEQNKSSLSSSEYAEAKRRIAAASKRFGIKSEYSKPARAASRGLRMRINTDGSIHVRHNSDIVGGKTVFCEQFELDSKTIELADGKPKAVWIQVAKPGEFKGHPAGPFKLDATTFNDIVRNFRATQNRRIAIDFEHASEQKPTDGGIPVLGAPAQGWMTDFDIRPDGLYSLVEWLPLAADYIKTGQYKYFSPAIRFDAVDRVTGKNIGARMTSGALTNKPFLDGMQALLASDRDDNSPAQFAQKAQVMIITPGQQAKQLARRTRELQAAGHSYDTAFTMALDEQSLLLSETRAAKPARASSLTKLCSEIRAKMPGLSYDDAFTMALEQQQAART